MNAEVFLRNINAVGAFFVDLMNDDDEDHSWVKVTVNIDDYSRMEDPSFRKHFRLNRELFEILHTELGQHLLDTGGIVRQRTEFAKHLLMVLWILATPDTFRSVALRFGVYPREVHEHYVKIITGLRQLGHRYITWPNHHERLQISRRFEEASGIPGTVGLIDGKHFVVSKPLEDPAAYRDRKKNYSITAQAVCDDRRLVRDLYVGEPGSLHDGRVYRRSPLGTAMLVRPQELLSPNQHIIGDSAYTLVDTLMTPFVNNGNLHDRQKNYNRKLSGIRVRIEQTFGDVTLYWRRVKHHFEVRRPSHAVDHLCSVFVLHNFRIIHGGDIPPVGEVGVDHGVLENEAHVLDDDHMPHIVDLNDIEDDPHVPQEFRRRLAAAKLRGEHRRWDIVNLLPMDGGE